MMRLAKTYSRIWPFVRAVPLLAAVPLVVELVQHLAEIELGFYAAGAAPSPAASQIRLAFGALKVLGLLVAIIAALRWWAFDGDTRRALRPTWALGKGLLIYVLVEALGEGVQDGLDRLFGMLVPPSHAATVAIGLGDVLLWVFVSGLWLPWYVGLLVEDRGMSFRRSVRTVLPGIGTVFLYVCAGVIPLMATHYALGYLALGRPPVIVWSLNALDAVLVPVLALAIASSFYTVYRWAVDRSDASNAARSWDRAKPEWRSATAVRSRPR